MKKILIGLLIFLGTVLIVYANDIPNAGIGVILKKENNKIIIDKIYSNSPAELKGLKTKDVIVEIDGYSTENLQLKEVQSKIIGKKNSKLSIKVLRGDEIKILGFKKHILVPYAFEISRDYDFDSDLPIKVFKNGSNYYVKMASQDKNLLCYVTYKRNGINYFREMHCEKDDNTSYFAKPRTNVELPTETWKNIDTLIFNKYGEYSIWHDNPDPNVKSNKEIQLAKILNPPPPKNGDKCKAGTVTGVWKNGACHYDPTEGMTKQEKEDYFRAKDFEEELDNYLRNK